MALESLKRDYPYLNNTLADIRLLGYPAILSPFLQAASGSRIDMWSSHRAQAMVLHGCEFPYIFTGVEYDDGQYEINKSTRDQDIVVIDVIPKYPAINGGGTALSPEFIVIYEGVDDKMIGYFPVERYTAGSAGFGYENKLNNLNRYLAKDRQIPKDVVLVTSPAHKGAQYCTGVNANVAYMSTQETVEDSFWISQSLADKMQTTLIDSVPINLRQDMRPLNLYGNAYEHKFIPDIGEKVRSDGLLMAVRPVNSVTCAADTSADALSQIQNMQDTCYYIEPGSIITDVDFYVNRQKQTGSYTQMDKYQRSMQTHWQSIFDIYQKYKHSHQLTPAFSTLVDKAITRMLVMGMRVPGFNYRSSELEGINGQTVEFIQMVVKYKANRVVKPGFKSSDRSGGKGVVSKITPDEEMPVDDFGIRADILISVDSPVARMIGAPLYEQYINRISEFVRRRCEEEAKTNPLHAYETLLDWYNDVNPNYAATVRECHLTEHQRKDHVATIITKGICLNIPPFLNTITLENMRVWRTKWNVPLSPVTYTAHDLDGTPFKVRTEADVCIGSKYIYCLAKIPHVTSAGAGMVSHQGLTVKPSKETKHFYPVSMTPVKMGEDEQRISCMDVDAEEVVRLNNLLANSSVGLNKVIHTLMTHPHPTAIERFDISNEELGRTNATLALFHHQTSILGIETRSTRTTDVPPEELSDDGDILEIGDGYISDLEDFKSFKDNDSLVSEEEADYEHPALPDEEDSSGSSLTADDLDALEESTGLEDDIDEA